MVPIFCFHLLLFLCELCAVFVFLVLLYVYSGSYCSALWFVLFPILSVVFLLLLGVTDSVNVIAVGFVFGRVVGEEVDGGVCRCRFPIYVYFQVELVSDY